MAPAEGVTQNAKCDAEAHTGSGRSGVPPKQMAVVENEGYSGVSPQTQTIP